MSTRQPNYWKQTCPAERQYTVEFTGENEIKKNLHFGFEPVGEVEELRTNITGSRMYIGSTATYSINLENVGTLPFTGTITLTYDPRLTFVGLVPNIFFDGVSRHNGSTIELDISNLNVAWQADIQLVFALPADASLIGKQICAHVKATPAMSHGHIPNPIDTEGDECSEVASSYAPHSIAVSPAGIQPQGYISQQDTVLHYTLHFQNTDEKVDRMRMVIITNRVPEQLDLSTFRLCATSHPCTMTIIDGRTLQFEFYDINLPNSAADNAGSRGYAKYEIQLHKNLPVGTEIRNTANIHLAYNTAPVQTNEVLNTIGTPQQTSVQEPADSPAILYPNPANNHITISSPLLVPGTIAIYNSIGTAVMNVHHAGGSRANIPIDTLAPGVYVASYPTAGGAVGKMFTVMK